MSARSKIVGEQQQPEQPPPLKGGVDLGSPIMTTIRQFSQEMATEGVACILIGMNKQGGVSTRIVVPGGIVPILGMMEFAKQIIADQLKTQRQP